MMKVSDPILFGAAVRAFFKPVLDKHSAAIEAAGVDFNNGLGDLMGKLPDMDAQDREAIETSILRKRWRRAQVWPW